MASKRMAVTLVEVLEVIGILSLLVAMAFPAIMRVQAISLRLQSMNNLRALMQAVLHYSSDHGGSLPGISLEHMLWDKRKYPLHAALPYLGAGYSEPWGKREPYGWEYPTVAYYLSPTDPSAGSDSVVRMVSSFENTSYSTNAQVCDGLNRLGSISDGCRYTSGISERYRSCFNNNDVNTYMCVSRSVHPLTGSGTKFRTSTFADKGYRDVLPVTLNGVSLPSIPGSTLQMTPTVENADGRVPQATQRSGLLAIMMDRSIRTFSSDVKPSVFRGAITPAGNEIIPPE
jgi:type II secretory pathway pseudopilin PulG